jgi:hypothetical protein
MASDPPITTPSEALVDLAAWLRELGWSAMRNREHLQDNYSIARQRLSTGFTVTRKRKRSYPHLPRRLVWRAAASLGRRHFLGGSPRLRRPPHRRALAFLDNGAWTSAIEANKLSSSSWDGALSPGVRTKAALTDYVGCRPRNRPDDVAGPGSLEPSAAPDAVLRRAQSALRCR